MSFITWSLHLGLPCMWREAGYKDSFELACCYVSPYHDHNIHDMNQFVLITVSTGDCLSQELLQVSVHLTHHHTNLLVVREDLVIKE